MNYFDKVLKVSGPAGYLASSAMNKIEKKEGFDEKKSVITEISNLLIYLALAFLSGYLHYKCHNNSFAIGIIPAILCPSCYLLVFFLTKSSCPSEIQKLLQLQPGSQ